MKNKRISDESKTGYLLLSACFIALVWANSPWADTYKSFWETELAFTAGRFSLTQSLHEWVNNGFMILFFFSVGLEIKGELVGGELNTPRRALLPAAAAIGGILIPALIYSGINYGTETAIGWGVPMATDIAFSVVLLAVFRNKVAPSLVVFLTALAVVDDLGSILVIAIFYSSDTDLLVLSVALGFFLILLVGNSSGIRNPSFYLIIGVAGLWYFFLRSGVHATTAGVLIALSVPARTRINAQTFGKRARRLLDKFINSCASGTVLLTKRQADLMEQAREVMYDAETPLQRWNRVVQPIVNFGVLPLFALSNAGVVLSAESADLIVAPVGLGILLALWLGKPIGILLSTFVLVKLNVVDLPHGATWHQLIGVSALAGIGFTVSLFITELAFTDELTVAGAKLSILVASAIAALTGVILLSRLPSPTL